jgi:hypothetical protein
MLQEDDSAWMQEPAYMDEIHEDAVEAMAPVQKGQIESPAVGDEMRKNDL